MKINTGRIFSPTVITVVIFIVFALIYCLISLVNHYQLRTYAADLGIFEHAVYSFSRFRADYITLNMDGNSPSFLGDHFSPVVILFVPFYWLFGSYGLLIAQILVVLAGGLGVYKVTRHLSSLSWLPVLVSLNYFSIVSIYSALAFDFHTNVVAAGLFPWLIYYYYTHKKTLVVLFFLLIILCKETMPIWMAFIIVGLMFMKRKKFRDYLHFEIPLVVLSLLFFWFILQYYMPYLRDYKGEGQMIRYSYLGDGVEGVAGNLIRHPLIFIEALYKNSTGEPFFNGVKTEFHLMVLLSGGLALLFRPAWLFMLIPLYAQKLLSLDPGLWGINNHYSIEFVPVICVAMADALSRLSKKSIVYALCGLQVVITMGFTYAKLENREHQWYDRVNNRFYVQEHFNSNLNLDAVYSIINNVPPTIPLSVSFELAPHLAFRDKIYSFPVIRDAEMIVIFSDKRGDYPMNRADRKKFIVQLEQKKEFRRILDRDDIIILQRSK